jgi:hypothetical protein
MTDTSPGDTGAHAHGAAPRGMYPSVTADVEPLDVTGVRTMAVGTALWLIGFLALLPFYGRLSDAGHLWWLWTCLAGFGLGLFGMEWCRMRASRLSSKEL